MNILFLGPDTKWKNNLIHFLSKDESVYCSENKLELQSIKKKKINFLISYNYRYIISQEILNHFENRAINLHISYLPWNKGSDPNLWSILESTKKGVTIHQIDKTLDTGRLLCQKQIIFNKNDTLKTSYEKLHDEIVVLFKKKWFEIKTNKIIPKIQNKTGTYHKLSDKNEHMHLLNNGWETKIKDLEGKALND
jgi:methionyl-tRNA formyltransferase